MYRLYAFLILAIVLGHYANAYQDYDGYQVRRYEPRSESELNKLHSILKDAQVDVWHYGNDCVDAMLGPDDTEVTSLLDADSIPYSVFIEDVQRLVEASQGSAELPWLPAGYNLNTSRFYNLTEIHAFLEEQAAVCGADCSITQIGSSYEGRPLTTIKISRPGTERRAVWVDGGIHAREWLTPASATYFVDKLINGYGVDDDVTLLRDAYDWYVYPVANPDGYEYTWTTDRMWRKTRSPNQDSCYGTDPNRNFDFQWGPGDNNTCSEVYQGPSAESESEIAAYTSYVMSISASLDLMMSYHTYGEILVMPWAYSTIEPPDIADLERLADICVNAVNANSTLVYEWGQVGNPTGGLSMDWARGVAGVKYTYVMEMRGGQTGYGFVAPPSEILPNAQENWAGVVAMLKDLLAQP